MNDLENNEYIIGSSDRGQYAKTARLVFGNCACPYGKAESFIRGHTPKSEKDKDFIAGDVIRKSAKKIHEAGGCDAQDDYSRGWDAGITEALDILLSATGYTFEEVLDYEEE